MQVIGLCRFSYPAIGGFQIEHDSIGDRIAYLYDDARMEERFRLFETVALPCLRAQTHQEFELICVIGDQLPKRHRDRLNDLTADMPQLRLRAEPPEPQRDVMKKILNSARRDPSEPCLQFRFDDDDAVAVDFIERLRAAADDSASLTAQHKAVAFDWNKGLIAEFGPKGIARSRDVPPLLRGCPWHADQGKLPSDNHELCPREDQPVHALRYFPGTVDVRAQS